MFKLLQPLLEPPTRELENYIIITVNANKYFQRAFISVFLKYNLYLIDLVAVFHPLQQK